MPDLIPTQGDYDRLLKQVAAELAEERLKTGILARMLAEQEAELTALRKTPDKE